MRKREVGQACILILILLAVGVLLVCPALMLTTTSLKSSYVLTKDVRALYAADAAQEYVLWKLTYDGYGAEFTNNGDSDNFTVNLCGIPVDVTVVMRATEGKGPICLATDDVIRPTKTVDPDTVPNDTYTTFTYTIRLEQLSDNTSQGLDAIYDILPRGFDEDFYVSGSSTLSVDGGSPLSIPDPFIDIVGGQALMKWPADYDWETGTGVFSSDPLDADHYFHGIRDFSVRQVKELEFQIASELPHDEVLTGWVVLKPWNTLSGPQAPITVGSPAEPEVFGDDGLLTVTKVSNPQVIQPGVETDIEYTVEITNRDTETHHIEEITDYLPAGFSYTDNSTSGLTTLEPQQSVEYRCDQERQKLLWTRDEFPGGTDVSIASGETLTLTFGAMVTKDVSGSYYNEITVAPDTFAPSIFSKVGVSDEDYYANYSWPTGAVIVPAYDSRADADGVIVDANMALILGGICIKSWQIY